MTQPKYDNHFVVRTKMQLAYALLAGSYPTYEEARANPFDVVLLGTNLRLRFPEGLHATRAAKAAAQVRRLNKAVFQPQ